ncbi:MAG: tRNA pseudouridine(55) synthase, partial [Candidatus Portnoybacteria bacterium CG_4_8_14_3_um_filter_44_10]
YIAEIKFGEESSTDDEEGEKKAWSVGKTPRLDEVGEAVKSFRGFIAQTPPIYSAIKIGGQKAYELARENIKIELKPREIEIKEIEILDYEWPFLKIRVVTGPGVYIRALARDIGRELGVGGYLVDLERTRVGDFTKEKTIDILDIKKE